MNIVTQKLFRTAHFITQPLSGFFLHNSERVRVVVHTKNEILLIRSSFGSQKWSLPGGGVHKGEESILSASRELLEETSLKLSTKELKSVGVRSLPTRKKWPRARLEFFDAPVSKKLTTRVTRPYEIMDVKWWNIDKLPEARSETVDVGLELSSISRVV